MDPNILDIPMLQNVITTTITTQRASRRPSADLHTLKRLRRQLPNIDNPTSFDAFRIIRDLIGALPLGHPDTAALCRLAADLADKNSTAREASRAKTARGNGQ